VADERLGTEIDAACMINKPGATATVAVGGLICSQRATDSDDGRWHTTPPSDVGPVYGPARGPGAHHADVRSVDVSGVNASLAGLAAAQAMFGPTAAAAAGTGSSGGDASGAASGVGVAVLKMALDTERRIVDIFA
jgi:hypothetical protein